MFRFITLGIVLYSFAINANGQDTLMVQNGEQYIGRVTYNWCDGRKDQNTCVRIRGNDGLDKTFTGEEVIYFYKWGVKYLVKVIPTDSIYRVYPVLLDGEVQVIDLGFPQDDNVLVAAVIFPNGLLMPVTKKLYEKWILPEYLNKEAFKEWYERNETLKFPKRRRDRLGGRKQNQITEFIIKVTTIYNRL